MGVLAWLVLVVFVIGGAAATLAWARREDVVLPATAGLVAQGVIAIGLYFAVGLWAPDAGAYDELGRQFAAYWGGGPSPDAVGEGKEAFPLMLGAVYYVVGTAPAIGLAMNWASHGLLVTATAALARRLDLPVKTTAWMVALFPPALFWSAFLLRESITWLLMVVFLYAVAGIARGIGRRDVAIMMLSLAALLWFRGTAAIILAGASMLVLVLTAKRRTALPRFGVAALALLVLSPRLATLLAGYTSVSDIEAKRSDLTNAESSFDDGDPISPADPADVVIGGTGGDGGFVASLIDSFLRVAFGPYPWEWPSVGLAFAPDAVMWIAILGLAVLAFWRAPNRMVLLLVVLPAAALCGALVVTSGNYGTMQRLRVQSTVLLLPIAAGGWSFLWAWVRSRRAAPATDPVAPS